MSTAVVLCTRDLRVHDNPGLAAACAEADRVVPLFVFDDAVLAARVAAPNKVAFLLDSVRDLASSLRDLGGALFTRRGDVVDAVGGVVADVDADVVHVADDVTGYAGRRLEELHGSLDIEVLTHPGVTVVAPGEIVSSSGGHYERFTPYWRRWRDVEHRMPVDVPDGVSCPSTLPVGSMPALGDLVDGPLSPDLPDGGETAGRALLDAWLSEGVATYDDGHDDLAGDCTSRLSPYLHLGCVSASEVVARAPRRGTGVDAFVRQVCWRDYHHQVLAGRPASAWEDHNDRGDVWRDDDEAFATWREGRTGYPIVDAGMRQLRREGWMHNRARLIVASFLVRDLYVDWRAGARHFLSLLVDGDIANNQMNWQWVAGTGTHARPNRVLSPLRQAERFDPHGDYVRRYVDELAGITGSAVHRPWEFDDEVRADLDYPDPIVDHADAVDRFRAARGLD
ncbi:MAG TPA: deoxyribodipyrimidine photo-lyase [Euzebyales bacterium]|nr:deoxyribodipyrimidine photo-lyase [Euzebyales bacterium]